MRKQTKTRNIVRITVFSRKQQAVGIENPSPCILFPAPALETAGSHARTTRASIDLLRSILRNRIRAVLLYIIARVACVSRSRNSFNIHHFETVGISDRFTKKREEEKFPLLLNNRTFLRTNKNRNMHKHIGSINYIHNSKNNYFQKQNFNKSPHTKKKKVKKFDKLFDYT